MYHHNDYIGKIIDEYGYYELNLLKYTKSLNLSGLALDIGANIGNHSVYYSKECGFRVYAYEPYIENFKLLALNTNNLDVKNHLMGVGDKKDKMDIGRIDRDNMGDIWLEKGDNIGVDCIDNLINEPVSLIKIDVQGMERAVIKGGIKTIKKYKPHLFVEFNEDLHPLLTSLGYSHKKTFLITKHYET